ncbi:MAG: hypothetical protein O3C60_10755 [Planctomycetota bacterium]|nr:hypothetical protein [Planctomycetota bacterium]
MPRLISQLPRYRKHASGQAFVYLDGRNIYLGPYRSLRSREAYDRVISEWTANGRRLPASNETSTTIVEICAAYLRHAKLYYPQLQHRVIKAIQVVTKLYGRTSANDFSPLSLKACRQSMVGDGGSRNYVNRISGQIKYMFKWAASEELISHEVPAKLATVEGLRAGRTEAPETDPISPVADEDVNKTLGHLPLIVQAMVRLQRLTGIRPDELCSMRPMDIDRTRDVINSDTKSSTRNPCRSIHRGAS